jgi:hypothetical protein
MFCVTAFEPLVVGDIQCLLLMVFFLFLILMERDLIRTCLGPNSGSVSALGHSGRFGRIF